jgi:hypothetical protein
MRSIVLLAVLAGCSTEVIFLDPADPDPTCGAIPDIACIDPCTGEASAVVCDASGRWVCPPVTSECCDTTVHPGDCVDECDNFYAPTCVGTDWQCIDPGLTCDTGRARWSHPFPGNGFPAGSAVAVDPAGSVIVLGSFTDDVDVGFGPMGSEGGRDLFLVKFDADGTLLWAYPIGGAQDDEPFGLAVRPNGSVVVGFSFLDAVWLDGIPLLSSPGGSMALVELDAMGGLVWAKSYGVYPDPSARGVAVSPSGHITVAGTFWTSTASLGAPLVSPGGGQIFVARLDEQGNHVWSRSYGDAETQTARAVAIDPAGHVLFTGDLDGSVDIDGIVLSGQDDAYVAKLFDSGDGFWAHHLDGTGGTAKSASIAADSAGDAYVVGHQDAGVLIGSFELGSFPGAFVAKLDLMGGVTWAGLFPGTSERFDFDRWSVAVDPSGNVVLGGQFKEHSDAVIPQNAAGDFDVLLVKLDGDGVQQWGWSFGGPGLDFTADVATGPRDVIAITGAGQLDFGQGLLDGGFVALFGPDGT